MRSTAPDLDALLAENAELRARLEEAEETLAAIRTGQVDALVVGEDIYTLESVDASSNRLRKDVLAQMEDAVVARDDAGHVIYLNPAAERRYAMGASQALGRRWRELCEERWPHPQDEAAALAAMRDVGTCHTSTLHVTHTGESFHAESAVSRLSDANGNAVGYLAVIRDVSERRRAEARIEAANLELARRERQFSTLVENSPDIIARFDRDLRHLYVNRTVTQYTGIAPAAFVGRTNADMGMPAELCGEWEAALDDVLRSGRFGRIGFSFATPDDGVRRYEARLIPEFAADGTVESVLSLATDVTERERIDAALRESRAHLQFTLEAAGVGDWDLDLTTLEARHSLRHDRCFGYTEALPHWDMAAFLAHVHPADRDQVERLFAAAVASLDDWHFDCRVIWPDASVHWIEVHGAIYKDGDKPLRMLGIVIDATLRKSAEQALRDANRNKDEFLATLAHELRNPLAPIRNALEVLRRTDDARVLEDVRNVIERQLKQMVHLVDDLLDISRITQGKVTLRREPVDVASAVRSAVETSSPLIEGHRHRLTLQLPPPGVLVVEADQTRLIQIVANLLNNAAKYTPDGGSIEVCAIQDGSSAAISVQDNGPGIPSEMLPRVFDMFSQIGLTLERAQGGLGIGLALVKKFTELHGGEVEAHSGGAGPGSRFTIRLPLLQGRVSGEPVALPPPPPAAPLAGTGLRVLVVDDNADSADSLAMMLGLMGMQTLTAHDGVQALRAAESFRPDVMLLDIGLPLLDGHGVAREIRRQPWGKDLLLIALSGWGQDEDRRKSHAAGFDRHLVKPVDPDALGRLLASHRSAIDG